jgi:hypothetical protein
MLWQRKENQTVYNLDVAYGIVRERLARIDVRRQCECSGAVQQPDGSVVLRYLNQTYHLDIPQARASLEGSKPAVSLREQILLLHYFTQAKGTPLARKQITYRDLPGGLVYYPTFVKRTIEPLVDYFGERPPLLIKAGVVVGGSDGQMGDSSLFVLAFPRVPVTIILWRGDGELPPGGNLLFDASISDYLESEDVTVVCETITWRLVNYARTL